MIRISESTDAGLLHKSVVDDYLRKPVSKKEIVAELKKYPAYKTDAASDQNETITASCDKPMISSLPGIDVRAGLNLVGDDEKFYKKFLRMFYERCENSESVIRDLLYRNEMKLAEIEIHTLKGMSAHIGATELHSAACRLEQAVRGREDISVGNLLDRFGDNLRQVLNSIRNFAPLKKNYTRQVSENRKFSDLDPKEQAAIREHLHHLSSLIRSGNLEAEDYIGIVRQSMSGLGMEARIAELEKHIENYDFRLADNAIDEILNLLDTPEIHFRVSAP